MSLSEVSNILWRERQLLELLVFKLEEEQLVLASGRTRWLSYATREVETILGEIKRVELERAMEVAGAVGELGLSDSPSLRELAAIAPTPWDGIFVEHRRALLSLAQEIEVDHEVEPRSAPARPPGRARSARVARRPRHGLVRRERNHARPFARAAPGRPGDLMKGATRV